MEKVSKYLKMPSSIEKVISDQPCNASYSAAFEGANDEEDDQNGSISFWLYNLLPS